MLSEITLKHDVYSEPRVSPAGGGDEGDLVYDQCVSRKPTAVFLAGERWKSP